MVYEMIFGFHSVDSLTDFQNYIDNSMECPNITQFNTEFQKTWDHTLLEFTLVIWTSDPWKNDLSRKKLSLFLT